MRFATLPLLCSDVKLLRYFPNRAIAFDGKVCNEVVGGRARAAANNPFAMSRAPIFLVICVPVLVKFNGCKTKTSPYYVLTAAKEKKMKWLVYVAYGQNVCWS